MYCQYSVRNMHISKVILNRFGEKREIKTLESGVNLEIGERLSSILKKNYITRNIFFWDERRTWEWGVGGVATVLTTPGRS